jgi:hypothetical protein
MSTEELQPSTIFDALMSNPERYEVFAVVIDGEVALLMPINKMNEMIMAVWSSSPQIIKVDENTKTVVRPRWLFDGTNFISPAE